MEAQDNQEGDYNTSTNQPEKLDGDQGVHIQIDQGNDTMVTEDF